MSKVKILGTEYTIVFNAHPDDMPEDADGCMDQSTRTIKVGEFEPDRNSIQDLVSYRKKVLRHEIIHAFLYESGLWSNSGDVSGWAQSEVITDWIAIQFPKMLEAFKEADAI